MKTILPFFYSHDNFNEYNDSQDLLAELDEFGYDGFEIMPYADDNEGIIPYGKIYGLHLSFFTDWIDFWLGNRDALDHEFGGPSVWKEFYGSDDPSTLIDFYRKDLDLAQMYGVDYVVFHVSSISTRDMLTGMYKYSNSKIIQLTIEFANQVLSGQGYQFKVLFENMMLPGLNLNEPSLTQALLDGVSYSNTGLLLDVGHFLGTLPANKPPKYYHSALDQMFDAHNAKGMNFHAIHLHAPSPDIRINSLQRSSYASEPDFYKRFAKSYELVQMVDCHQPLLDKELWQIIKDSNPSFVTTEFVANNRKARRKQMALQQRLWM